MESPNPRLPNFAPQPNSEEPLIPARMLNEFVYCPRLAYLMWTQSEWVDSADTVEGKRVHRRVDQPGKPLPDASETSVVRISKSITLASEKLGVIARIDVAEANNGIVTPVDYKKGKRPHVAKGSYLPERVQVCVQAMLLEENGYRVDRGVIYFSGSKERVHVELDDELRNETLNAIADLRLSVGQGSLPPPLRDSAKCPRCALVSVCLPDETHSITGSKLVPRPIAVPKDYSLPLIIQSQGACISKSGETLRIIDKESQQTTVRFIDVSDVSIYGNVSLTMPALTALMEREIPVTFHSFGGWFRGMATGLGHKNVEIRTAQYRASFDSTFRRRFARDLVAAKITNQRTIVRRNWKGGASERKDILRKLDRAKIASADAKTNSQLLGIEGEAASNYFRAFAGMLSPTGFVVDKRKSGTSDHWFKFEKRNRRPPTDPVNSMLSYGYAILTRQFTVALASIGLDPYRGFFHEPRYGRPSLALDIMEPFRPLIVDSVVLRAVNTSELTEKDFVVATTGTSLTQTGRKKFLQAFERRLSMLTTHALFGYQLSMRRLIVLQSRLLSRHLLGELPIYPHYLPR